MERNKKIAIGAGIVVVVLAAAGIGVATTRGGDDTASTSATSSSSSTGAPTTAAAGPVAPLTGLPLADDAIRNRPLLTVKIDNAPEARPQFGIQYADDVVEEKVEGGISRFMALFQSQDADPLGPVRSLRATDANWLKPEGGMIAYSGGIAPVRALLKPAGITDIGGDTEGPKYYQRMKGRPYEHSLYVQTKVLRELTPSGLAAPKPLYTYLSAGEAFGGAGATAYSTVQGKMGPGSVSTSYAWTWDPSQKKWLRTTDGKSHTLQDAGQIAFTNVILQYTPYEPTPYRDRANTVVDQALTTGTGDAWILSDGKLVTGKWSRPTENDITTFTDSTGNTIKLTPGQTWLQLVPKDIVATPYP